MISCLACVSPGDCKDAGRCLNTIVTHGYQRASLDLLANPRRVSNATQVQEEKKKPLTGSSHRPTFSSPAHKRPARKDRPMTTDRNEIKARIEGDIAFCKEHPEEFLVGNGKHLRLSTTSMLRTVVALNPDVGRKLFMDILEELGYNRTTANIQFNQSRKESVEGLGCVLHADGTLTDN